MTIRPPAKSQRPTAASEAERLASTAAVIVPPHAAERSLATRDLDEFVRLLRDWVIEHHDLPGSRAERVERSHLLLYAMASAATMEEALARLVRFRRLVWGDRGARIESNGDTIALVLEQPHRPGIAGLLGDLWSLSFLLAELEFLAGGRIDRVSGRVRSGVELQSPLAPILFAHPLDYGAADLTLCLPAGALARPVLARGEQAADFLRRLMPHTVGAQAAPAEIARLVTAILHADRQHGLGPVDTLGTVAAQLGYAVATLRRRLAAERTSFRALREQVYDDLATAWLREGVAVEAIAGRLGYSDAFAFRRAFHRRHGHSPTAYRRAHAGGVKN